MAEQRTRPPDIAEPVRSLVTGRVEQWQRGVTQGAVARSADIAILAKLRRGLGKEPGAIVELLPYTWSGELTGRDDGQPTKAERAAHLAICLYALHQQSQRQRMHRKGRGFGQAARELVRKPDELESDPATRRFVALATAADFAELTHHARGLVQLFRGAERPVTLDYGLFAQQLVYWQGSGADRVRSTWGKEFYRTPKSDGDSDRDPVDDHDTDDAQE